jgi:hypothetical protein
MPRGSRCAATDQARAGGDQRRRGALEHDPATVMTGAGTEIDDPVRVGHHRQVMLNHHHRLARIDEAIQQPEQMLGVRQA